MIIKDIATSKTLLKQNATAQNETLFELIQILLDELDTESAIEILESIKTKVTNDSRFNPIWVKLMVQAYIDQGESGQARTLILSAFKAEQLPQYWLLFLKAGGNSQNDLPLFMEILSKKELEIQITFLSELENFSKINRLIIANSSQITNTIEYNLYSFYRKLSTQLAKQGLFHSAILLRQSLSEATVNLKKSNYYQYAISDIKKAIDYTIESQSSELFTLMNNWLTEFHQQHAKKLALWSLFYQKIDPALIKFD